MIEFLAIPAVMLAAALMPKGKSERKDIEGLFKASQFGVQKEKEMLFPRYMGKQPIKNGQKEVGVQYTFALPDGFSETKINKFQEDNVLGVGLNKQVTVSYENGLKVRVYHEGLPDYVKYEELSSKKWVIPVGVGRDKPIYHNFDHIPHMVVSGTTRFGKTVFLKNILTRLIENQKNAVSFHIIDLKGGLEFTPYARLKQVRGVASDVYEASETIRQIIEEMERQQDLYKQNGWNNVLDTPIKERTFIIVDEAAQLTPDKWMDKETKKLLSYCQSQLARIAAIGGALGYRLIFATQYPTADTLPRQIKQNADAKLSFRLTTSVASQVAIDAPGAEKLPSDVKGRALYKTHEIQEVQVPFIGKDDMMNRLADHIELNVKEANKEDEHAHQQEERAPGKNLIEFRKSGFRHP